MRVMLYEHHGKGVFVREDLKGRHNEFCLCQKCKRFSPGSLNNCSRAEKVYRTCVEENIVTPMWECADFIELS